MSAVPQETARAAAATRGIALMVLAVGIVTANDAVMKWVLAEMPVGEAICLRGVFTLVVIAFFSRRIGGRAALRWNNPAAQLFCGCCFAAAMFCYFYAVSVLPLALAAVVIFTSPLFVTALAPFALGERVGWWRRGAVLLGFVGVGIVIQPGGEGFTWVLLLPLAAAFLDAVREMVTRRIIAGESSGSLLVSSMVVVTLSAAFTAPFGWVVPDAIDVLLLFAAACALSGGLFLTFEAIRVTDVSILSPFKYTGVLWATLYGFVFWGDVPTWATALGGGLIIAGGLVIVAREHSRAPKPSERART